MRLSIHFRAFALAILSVFLLPSRPLPPRSG
jgi:hypothetical protein